MSAAFTPGPWLKQGRAIYALNAEGTNRFYASVQNGQLDKRTRTGEPELEANAHLIAAAPDLYEICAEFVRRVEAGEVRSKRTYAAMQAALAKARGEA